MTPKDVTAKISRIYWEVILPPLSRQAGRIFSKKSPVYVFHHIPKCGGTSLIRVLHHWFVVEKDYRKGWSLNYGTVYNISSFTTTQCLCGHFELEGFRLSDRYPAVHISPERYKVFCFVRDPLEVRTSLFNFEAKNKVKTTVTLEDFLFSERNYLAKIFNCNEQNYCDILDSYFFIGILERAQESLDLLANLIGRPKIKMPKVNKTISLKKEHDEKIVKRFKEENALDYKIYNYCQVKLSCLLSAKESSQTII